jgi:hypothetical protein
MNLREFEAGMERLLDALCVQRAYGPLRTLLPHYPMPNGFTDEWVNLANALKTVRTQNRTGLRPEDMELVISLQHAAESALADRPSPL